MERTKRKTAGRRMGALVGKAQEQDDAFWGHETWADDGSDSGNESFHDSDEDSANKKDEFDSDFNDSESDHEDEEREAGMEAERELKRSERSNQQKSAGYKEVAGVGKGKRVKGAKRVVGAGMNAGIVLNFPPPSATSAALPLGQTLPPGTVPVAAPYAAPKKTASKSRDTITLASTRERRSQQMLKRLRENRSTVPCEKHKKIARPSATKKAKRRRYGQEELILEAIHDTEPENRRWLLARKRVQDLADQDKDSLSARDRAKGKVTQKYHSRRGCLNTLTFPEMDHVPDILTRSNEKPKKPDATVCVITGKPARYRDPKTKLGYHDIAAFKELRRRHEAGEPLAHMPEPPTPSDVATSTVAVTSNNAVNGTANSSAMVSKQSPKAPPSLESISSTQSAIAKSTAPKVVSKAATPKSTAPTAVSKATTPKSTAPTTATKTAAGKSITPKAAASKAADTKAASKPAKKKPAPTKQAAVQKAVKPGAATKAAKTPEMAKSVISNSNLKQDISPVSPGGTRQSARKWKPSAKLLENITHSGEQKKQGALSLGIHLKPQLMDLSAPELHDTSAKGAEAKEPTLPSTAPSASETGDSTTVQPPKSGESESKPSAALPTVTPADPPTNGKEATGKPTVAPPVPPLTGKKAVVKPRAKKDGAKAAPKKAGKTVAKLKKPAAPKKKTVTAAEKTATPKNPNGSAKATKTNTKTKKAPVKAKKPTTDPKAVEGPVATSAGQAFSTFKVPKPTVEKIYMIPEDESSNGNHEPRFITQSELIMAAITNYNKSKDEKY